MPNNDTSAQNKAMELVAKRFPVGCKLRYLNGSTLRVDSFHFGSSWGDNAIIMICDNGKDNKGYNLFYDSQGFVRDLDRFEIVNISNKLPLNDVLAFVCKKIDEIRCFKSKKEKSVFCAKICDKLMSVRESSVNRVLAKELILEAAAENYGLVCYKIAKPNFERIFDLDFI